jgi:hypothetical protein
MQVDPFKPTLKAPGTKRLKLELDETGCEFCFQFQLAPPHPGSSRLTTGVTLGRAVQNDPIKPTLMTPVTAFKC